MPDTFLLLIAFPLLALVLVLFGVTASLFIRTGPQKVRGARFYCESPLIRNSARIFSIAVPLGLVALGFYDSRVGFQVRDTLLFTLGGLALPYFLFRIWELEKVRASGCTEEQR